VSSLPLIASLLTAAVVVPPLVRGLRFAGLMRPNYRGASVAAPTGVAIVAVALVALGPLALIAELGDAEVFFPETLRALAFVLGVALLGFLDDVAGASDRAEARPAWSDPYEAEADRYEAGADRYEAGADRYEAGAAPPYQAEEEHPTLEVPRGIRGHARATAEGRPSTGILKALGTIGLALFVLSGEGRSAENYLLAAAVLVLSTNLFNLLDLRPGRSQKALLVLGAGLLIGEWNLDSLWTLGLFVGTIVILLPVDLREQGMLGDTGSNAVGAVAGLWLVLTLSTTGLVVALVLLIGATAYGEFRSISALVDRTPGLRQIDSLGRASHA
jgi:UDP-GlcNAc:undecaprenyl-phosphate/decaprenyl-phosphate GlcNAc-1-phosphate transferase